MSIYPSFPFAFMLLPLSPGSLVSLVSCILSQPILYMTSIDTFLNHCLAYIFPSQKPSRALYYLPHIVQIHQQSRLSILGLKLLPSYLPAILLHRGVHGDHKCMCSLTSMSHALPFVKNAFLPFSTETVSSRPKPNLSSFQLTMAPLESWPPGLYHSNYSCLHFLATSLAMCFLLFYFFILVLRLMSSLFRFAMNSQHGVSGRAQTLQSDRHGLMPVLLPSRHVTLGKPLHLEPQLPYL